MSFSAKVYASMQFLLSGTNAFGNPHLDAPATLAPTVFSDGTGDYQAKDVFADHRTLAASTSENLDLSGSLADPLNNTISFATVKAILIEADAANTNDVIVGGAASNGFVGPFGGSTHTVAVRPGGKIMFLAPKTGWTVTGGTGDLLKVLNGGSGTSVSYGVRIFGTV